MANRKTYHVTSDGEGGWRVKAESASRASSTHENKADAVENAKDLAKAQPLGRIVIHGMDGKIQTEHTYGKDPYPPRQRCRTWPSPAVSVPPASSSGPKTSASDSSLCLTSRILGFTVPIPCTSTGDVETRLPASIARYLLTWTHVRIGVPLDWMRACELGCYCSVE